MPEPVPEDPVEPAGPARSDLMTHWDQAVDRAWIGAVGLVFGVTLRVRYPRIILADARLLSQRIRDRLKR